MTIHRARRITSFGATGILWGCLVAWLVACSATTPAASSIPAVAASEAALAAAGRAVLACYSVPACAAVAPKPAIKAAYDNAYSAVSTAQALADAGGTPDLAATAAAMTTLQSLVAQLPRVAS